MMPAAKPLSQRELDRLAALLADRPTAGGLDLEGMDGLFCALVIGPELVLPSEYMPVVFGAGDAPEFESLDEANSLLQLMMRHWNTVAAAVERQEFYAPIMFKNRDDGEPVGHRWAKGFMQGVALRRSSWSALARDGREGGTLLAIATLAGEVYAALPDRSMPATKHEELVELAVAAVNRIAVYFTGARRTTALRGSATVRRPSGKVGRNEPCPCGSGKKFKACCGRADRPTH